MDKNGNLYIIMSFLMCKNKKKYLLSKPFDCISFFFFTQVRGFGQLEDT